MDTIPNPDSWMDVATILLVALIAAVPSWLALRSHKAVEQQGSSVQEIRAQIVNGHGEARPLRADLDLVADAVQNVRNAVGSLSDDLHGLRADLREESDARRAHVGELRSDLAAARAELEHLRKTWIR